MNRVISGLVLISITAIMVLFPRLEKSDQVVRFDKSRILLYIVRFSLYDCKNGMLSTVTYIRLGKFR